MNKVFKSGCHAELSVVQDLAAFRRLLAVAWPIAVHIARWTYAARANPLELDVSRGQPAGGVHRKRANVQEKSRRGRQGAAQLQRVARLAVLGRIESFALVRHRDPQPNHLIDELEQHVRHRH